MSVCVSLEQSMGIIGLYESNFEDNLQVQKKQTLRSLKHLSQKILRKMLASRQRETFSDFSMLVSIVFCNFQIFWFFQAWT